ncbi:MAG: complex I NDUFA9 subunit family protein [Amaricoccus sp.]
MTVPVVTIFGGSGFIGRQVAQRMARAGWRVRVAVRRPEEAGFVRPYGFVGQVEPIQANIRDERSTRAAIAGADSVVNCVGILGEGGRQTFSAVLDQGAARIARLCAEEGVARLAHVSAIGADPASDSLYAAAKGRGEAAVALQFPGATIFRPSIVFGDGDGFFNRLGSIARVSPVMPIVGPDTRFQPVYVGDVAQALVAGATGAAPAGVYELGGPEVATFRDLARRVLSITRRRRMIVTLPGWVARLQASALDLVQQISGGLVTNAVLTRDQLRLLAHDNVVAPGARGLADLGIRPIEMEAVLESYLYCYRPHGQYDAITDSAQDLREERALRARS